MEAVTKKSMQKKLDILVKKYVENDLSLVQSVILLQEIRDLKCQIGKYIQRPLWGGPPSRS